MARRHPLALAVERLESRRLLAVASATSQPIAVGDLNGDGKTDIVEVESGRVAVLLNAGSSEPAGFTSFEPPAFYDVGSRAVSVALFDLTGSGRPDILVSTAGSFHSAVVLLNKGDGTFHPGQSLSIPLPDPFSGPGLAVADFNGDGKADLAIKSSRGTITIIPGRGDGTFDEVKEQVYEAGIGGPIAVGDFNGDGSPDLVTTSYSNGDLQCLFNRGDGTFAPPVTILGGVGTAAGIVVADFNGDGKDDIASYQHDPATLFVLLGDGKGRFSGGTATSLDGYPISFTAGDLNGDGKADIVLNTEGFLQVFLGHADGGQPPPIVYANPQVSYVLPPPMFGIALGDFDSVGHLDLALMSSTWDGWNLNPTTIIVPGRGDGTLRADSTVALSLSPSEVASADFNGDGRTDIVTLGVDYADESSLAKSSSLETFLSRGDGTFQPVFSYEFGASESAIAVDDLNGDGKADLVVVGSGSVSVLLGNGDGTFQKPLPTVLTGESPLITGIAVGDFNGDGRLDLAVPVLIGNSAAVEVLSGRGDGTFEPWQTISLPGLQYGIGALFAIGDFNGDAKPDLAIAGDYSTTVLILRGHGDGTFSAPTEVVAGVEVNALAVGDLNGDGRADIVVVGEGIPSVPYLLIGNGDGTFRRSTPLPADGSVAHSSVVIADFNGDGKPDVLVGGQGESLLLNRGDGVFQVDLTSRVGGGPYQPVIGHFFDDVGPDVAGIVGLGFFSYKPRLAVLPSTDLVPGRFDGASLAPLSGVGFSGAVATFSPDRLPGRDDFVFSASPSGYTATIDWGDGKRSSGEITIGPPPAAGEFHQRFLVRGSHTYAASGTYQVRVLLESAIGLGPSVTVFDTTTVTDAPLRVSSVAIAATEGVPTRNTLVAAMSDPGHGPAPPTQATIDWGDGTPSSSGMFSVRPGSSSNQGLFDVLASHTFLAPGTYTLRVTVRDSLGRIVSASGTSTVAGKPFALTGTLSTASDSGDSNNDGITSVDRPAFSGISDPGSLVQLFALRAGSTAPIAIGSTIADLQGKWHLTSSPLADGSYTITAKAIDRSGQFTASTLIHSLGGSSTLVIDTRPPALVRVAAGAGPGLILVTFRDDGSGLNLAGLLDATVVTVVGSKQQAGASRVRVLGQRPPTLPQTVAMVLPPTIWQRPGRYALRIAPGAVSDRAGNVIGGLVITLRSNGHGVWPITPRPGAESVASTALTARAGGVPRAGWGRQASAQG